MKLSLLIIRLQQWQEHFNELKMDPNVTVQIDQRKIAKSYKKGKYMDELELLDNTAHRNELGEENDRLVLFTCEE